MFFTRDDSTSGRVEVERDVLIMLNVMTKDPRWPKGAEKKKGCRGRKNSRSKKTPGSNDRVEVRQKKKRGAAPTETCP